MKKESLSASMSKLIMAVSLIVGIGAVIGVFGYFAKNKHVSVINQQSQISTIKEIEITNQVIDETADWKTYRNEKYGFELRYPKDWNLGEKSRGMGELYEIDFISSDNAKKVVTAYVFENSPNYPLDKWLKEYRERRDNFTEAGLSFEKEFSINGIKGIKGGFGCCMTYREAFFVAKGNYVYAIQGGYMNFDVKPLGSFYNYSQDFNRIIPTFKFIEKDEMKILSPKKEMYGK